MQSTPLSRYLGGVKDVVTSSFAEAWITAEILSISAGAHRYLELVEYDGNRREVAKASAVIWKGDAAHVTRFEAETSNKLQSGMKVLVKVKPIFHESFGFKLRVLGLDSTYTLGDMESRLRDIRTFLKEKGVYTLNKNLAMPDDFTRLAVISPPDAAGLGDFRVEADRLHALGICQFDYFHCAFQGENPGDLIVDAMAKVVNMHRALPYQALIIIRGGGDKSGLYQLNHRRLAHAICRTPMPVMIGIGHERDKLLLDEVAHSRFATPSLVISHIKETIVRAANEIHENFLNLTRIAHQVLDRAEHDADTRIVQLFDHAQAQLSNAEARADSDIERLVTAAEMQLDKAESGNERSMDQLRAHTEIALQTIMEQANQDLELVFHHAHKQLDKAEAQADQWISEVMAANPLAILQRGYAYAQSPDGFVTSSTQAPAGTLLTLTFKDGPVRAVVEASHD
ncbi:exodeoxyribonuclease VII large subunit [Pseudomonas sp. S1(2024)]|uniref:exodeoxyribonuclease VII large subunit n=1 Tax=Pseudomonas sp. S1(2024) TaxID=3390191 RepID=UPI00397AB713